MGFKFSTVAFDIFISDRTIKRSPASPPRQGIRVCGAGGSTDTAYEMPPARRWMLHPPPQPPPPTGFVRADNDLAMTQLQAADDDWLPGESRDG